jgi:hypothetical protein
MPAQPVRYRQTAHAVVAENNDARAVVIQLIQVLWNGLHRDQRRAFDVADGVLRRFANIDQTERLTSFQESVYFGWGYLNWQRSHKQRVYQACYTQWLHRQSPTFLLSR